MKKITLKKKVIIPVVALAITMAAAGCGSASAQPDADSTESVTEADAKTDFETSVSEATESTEASASENTASAEATALSVISSDIFSDRDLDPSYDESSAVKISLSGGTAASDSSTVTIDVSTVTITSEGTYILSGTLEDGMIIVDCADTEKVQLVLDGVEISSSSSAAIYVKQADKVFVTLADGSTNTLSNGGEFVAIDENNIDAVIFSKEDLTLNGNGALTITSPAGHGIVSKDSLKVTGGTYEITSASHGLSGKDEVSIADGSYNIASGKDGIHAENTDDGTGYVYIEKGDFVINAEGDGISGLEYVQVEDGSYDITSGGGSDNAEAHTNNMGGGFGGGQNGGPMGGFDRSGNYDQSTGDDQMGNGFGGGHGGGPKQRPENNYDPSTVQANTDEEIGADTVLATVQEDQSGVVLTSGEITENQYTDNTTDSSTSTKGIKSDGKVLINGGNFNIDSADDSIHSNGNVTIEGGNIEIISGDDGIHSDEALTINGGTIKIDESYEGLEGLTVIINDGDITLNATDDGINAAGGNDQSGFGGRGGDMFGSSSSNSYIQINGGTLDITAYGDGLDANGSLEITGGYTKVTGPTTGDTSVLDYDASGIISGGTFVGSGSSMMAQSLTGNGQGVIAVNAGNVDAGTQVSVTDESGNEIVSWDPELPYNVVIISDENITQGGSYSLTIGSSSKTVTAS